MLSTNISEQDWRLFKQRLPIWQEKHMEQLNLEYASLLNGSGSATEKFWMLEKRIRQDRRNSGVIAEMKRSNMIPCLIELLLNEIISKEDLYGFSEETIEATCYIAKKQTGGE